jgi:hypothetical protein
MRVIFNRQLLGLAAALAVMMSCAGGDGETAPPATAVSATASGAGGGGAATTGAGGASSGAGGGAPATAMLRVHIIGSSVDALDGASVIDQAGVENYLVAINDTFAVANITWVLESVVVQPATDESAYLAAVQAGTTGAVPLAANVDTTTLLAPNGWDMFVVKRTSDLGFGGAYRCTLDDGSAPGGVFVPALAANGQPQDMRKWTHELGHAMGLPHTPCAASHADNLMMSGACNLAEPDRTALTQTQIERIIAQLAVGGPVACGETDPDSY